MKTIFIPLAIISFTSCGGGEAETTAPTDSVEVCNYSYDSSSTILTWTAFKLTEKIGVNGTFDEINVVANDNATDMFGVLTGATFDIPVATLNSQDPIRDPTVKRAFFGNMVETASIKGSVISLNATQANMSITMNGVTKEYSGVVKVDGEKITVTTTIDIIDF